MRMHPHHGSEKVEGSLTPRLSHPRVCHLQRWGEKGWVEKAWVQRLGERMFVTLICCGYCGYNSSGKCVQVLCTSMCHSGCVVTAMKIFTSCYK